MKRNKPGYIFFVRFIFMLVQNNILSLNKFVSVLFNQCFIIIPDKIMTLE